jgi:urease accessory protein
MAITGITTIIMSTAMAEAALYDLLSWMSPMYPIGAFAYSGGLEWAVEAGHITDRESTRSWIADLIAHGSIRNDIVMFIHAWRAIGAGDGEAAVEIAELSLALQTGFERRLEATAQGAAFRKIARATIGGSDLAPLDMIGDADLTYAVAVACLTASRGITLRQALTAFLHGVVSNLVSAAQRLVPLGQTDGQLVLRDLRDAILEAAEQGEALPDSDPFEQIGNATMIAEIGCMAHETQYTRLFRT